MTPTASAIGDASVIPVRIRTLETRAPAHPPDRVLRTALPATYDPIRGWPVAIPPTYRTAYLSGMTALNLPASREDPHPGDWHTIATWWSPTYLDVHDRPFTAPLWGPDGDIAGAPAPPHLRDARPALARLSHPAGTHPTPILAATVPQAIVDLAWDQSQHGPPAIDRHTVARWTGRDDEDPELCMLARQIEHLIDDPLQRDSWRRWRLHHLQGLDHLDIPTATPPMRPYRSSFDITVRTA